MCVEGQFWSSIYYATGTLHTQGREHHSRVVTERDPDMDSKSVIHKSDININPIKVCIASDHGNIIQGNMLKNQYI